MFSCMLDHLSGIATDRSARVVVVTGRGRAFSAGGDISTMNEGSTGDARLGELQRVRNLRELTHTSQLLHQMPQVTIAAINGVVAGGGLSWAVACDLRYAAASARFVTAFVDVGLTGDFGISWFLPRIVGPGRARELLFFSEKTSAEDAARLGLVEAVFADDELSRAVAERAACLAAKAPTALAGMKANLNDAPGLPLPAYLDRESERLIGAMSSPDHREAVAAFLEKRAPRFGGGK
jgi:2-(1,2-epoxy-1,2-dihydrophenyl)acetyl-CoA isomerase